MLVIIVIIILIHVVKVEWWLAWSLLQSLPSLLTLQAHHANLCQHFICLQSRVVRNTPPTFIWSVRSDVCGDLKTLRRDQMLNHYGKASFTTKVR